MLERLHKTLFRPRTVCILFTILIILVYIFHWPLTRPHIRKRGSHSHASVHDTQKPMKAFKGAKIVHLDLKGAPFKISYYESLFPLLSKLGATGVLIEYEDMFPYNSSLLRNITALNAYTTEDIKYINDLAFKNNLDVMPLVQTFGHLEFLLKLEDYKEFREVPEFPQAICPTHEKILDLIIDMVSQVMDMHPRSKLIHIGADEVYHLGFCDRCINVMNKYNLSKQMLFLEHVNAVTTKIHRKYPHLGILMWDDELRSLTPKDFEGLTLASRVQPVVWKYTKDVSDFLGPTLWETYGTVFPTVWVASAFKGATGSNQYVCDVVHYVQNHRSWYNLISSYEERINFGGIILTGWQRYDHFSVLCELLPASLHSLAISLRVLQGYKDSLFSPPTTVSKLLGCQQPYALIGPAFGSPRCSYPGGDVLEGVLKLQQLKQEFGNLLEDSRIKGWLSVYNKKHEFSSPHYVQWVHLPLTRIKADLEQLDIDLTDAMIEIYDNFTICEWKETYLKPFEKEVDELIEAKNRILAKSSWPRRPLQNCDSHDDGF